MVAPEPVALGTLDIAAWRDISDEFQGADLLLGNGFSTSLSRVFAYRSLFESFLTQLDNETRDVVSSFRTTNFELILESLGTAAFVNDLLDIPATRIRDLAATVREGLIRTIELNHPRAADISWTRLERISATLNTFGDIYTLNYDALLYHIVMICKDNYVAGRTSRFNDYFWNAITPELLLFMDYQNYPDYKHVYYLHGALFLFKTAGVEELVAGGYDGRDVKLRTAGNRELLSAIARELRTGNLPLFVSEGTTEEKQRAIGRSEYLQFANAHLKANRSKMLVYGASFGENDRHIADAIRRGTGRVAVSIYVRGKTTPELQREMLTTRAALVGRDVSFFDSSTLFQ